MDEQEEQVLCFVTKEYNYLTKTFPKVYSSAIHVSMSPATTKMVPRNEAEGNKDYIQIVAYGLITCNGRLYYYTRTSQGGEDRLHNKKSVGFGGHVNLDDVNKYRNDMEKTLTEAQLCISDISGARAVPFGGFVCRGVYREIDEELKIVSPIIGNNDSQSFSMTHIGEIYDPTTSVSQEHLGILMLCEFPDATSISPRDGTVGNIESISLEDVIDQNIPASIMEGMENWSVEAIEKLRTHLIRDEMGV